LGEKGRCQQAISGALKLAERDNSHVDPTSVSPGLNLLAEPLLMTIRRVKSFNRRILSIVRLAGFSNFAPHLFIA
jgi:hypothetical protein